MLRNIIVFLFLSASVGAPARDTDSIFLALREMDRRVATIGYRLATANAEVCNQHQLWSGLVVHDLSQYTPSDRPSVQATFGMRSDYPSVLVVVPDGAAAQAGLREDEVITSISGERLPLSSPAARASGQRIEEISAQLEDATNAGKLELTVGIAPHWRDVSLSGVKGCAGSVEVSTGTGLEATSDGKFVTISAKLIAFVHNDDELAVIVGHEMAHNLLGHREALDAQGIRRGMLAPFGRNAASIRATEEQADYVSMYLVARAGYDITAARTFWNRFGRKTSWGFLDGPTHPRWRARLKSAEATIAEITAKRSRGEALIPDFSRLRTH